MQQWCLLCPIRHPPAESARSVPLYVCLCMLLNTLLSPAAGNVVGILPSFLGPTVHIMPYSDDAVRRKLHYNLVDRRESFGRSHDQRKHEPAKETRQWAKTVTEILNKLHHCTGRVITRYTVVRYFISTGSSQGSHG